MELKFYDDIVHEHEKEQHTWMCGTEGISFNDIDSFINAIPEDDDKIDILLHCRGGSISEGWAIVDKLRATGKKITATIDGQCASMAVCILLAASERRAYRHATLLIHNPSFEYLCMETADEETLRKYADELASEREKILDFYVERTGADREELSALMDEEKFIDAERAKELGFISDIIPDASASAANRRKTFNTQSKMAKTNSKAGIINSLASLLGVKVSIVEDESPVNYVLQTADGTELTIDKPEGEDPAVGDAASPDGEFAMPDGTTIVVTDGVITEIKPSEEQGTEEEEGAQNSAKNEEGDEMAEKDVKIAELEATVAEKDVKIAELEAEIEALKGEEPSEEDKAIVEMVNKAGGMDWLKGVTASDYKPAQRKAVSQNTGKSSMQQRLAEMKERNGVK